MAKLTLADLTSIVANETSAVGTINSNNTLIETALENTLSRDGTAPNPMGADLDMNSNQILNLPEPSSDTEPLRKVDINTFITVPNIFVQSSEPSTSNPEGSLWIDNDDVTNSLYRLTSGAWVDTTTDVRGQVGPAGPSTFVSYQFDSGTADADPGTGRYRLNDSDVTAATQLFISDNQLNGTDVSNWITFWDNSTSTTKGVLLLVDPNNSASFVFFDVTGNITDATTYFKVPIAHIGGSSTSPFANDNENSIMFSPTGDAGTGAVTSFESRVGAITSVAGDYTASEVTNVAAGNIIATDVQAALNELDTEKLKTHSGVNDNRLVRTDGVSGDAIQESGIVVDDSNNVSGIGNITHTGYEDLEEIVSPANPAVNVGRFYAQDIGGATRPLWKDSTGADTDLSDHDDLNNFVANEHIDHSNVDITAGSGLTGGGDITATRNLAVGAGTGITVNADDVQLDTSNQRNTDHGLVSIIAGSGLTGGGTITGNRTLDVGAGTGITVNADDIAISTGGVGATQIADNAVDNTKASDMASWTFKSRNAGTTGDPTDTKISALTEELTPASGDWILGEASTGELRRYNVGNLPTGGGGEANTGSNIGTAGIGVFDGKVGIDLQFKNINAGSTKVTVTDDVANNEVDIDVDGGLILDGEITGNGLAVRTAAETYTNRSVVGGSLVTVTNGDGVSGNPSVAVDEATSTQFRNNTADRVLTTDQTWLAAGLVTLTDAASIAVDMDTGFNFQVTLGANRTLANPTNTKVGQSGLIIVNQDGTGNRTLSYGANWEFPGGTSPTLTTTASAKDILIYFVQNSSRIIITGVLKNVS